jgi:hypothetical protein
VLLTRSPLSPVPKDRFSLDLHVLSAPPAFVLSQDQTLREGLVAGPEGSASFTLSLVLKGRDRSHDEDMPLGSNRSCRLEVSTFVNAVEFSKTGAGSDGVKKPPTRARGHQVHTRIVSDGWARAAPVVEFAGLFDAALLDGRGSIAAFSRRSTAKIGAFPLGAQLP